MRGTVRGLSGLLLPLPLLVTYGVLARYWNTLLSFCLCLLSTVSEVTVPSFIVVNLSSDSYFLPPGAVQTERHLLDFLDGVLDSSIQVSQGWGR